MQILILVTATINSAFLTPYPYSDGTSRKVLIK